MDLDTLAALCHSLAKAYSTGVRLYRGAEPLAYCSVYPLNPDPAGPHIPKILECGAEVGIITTSAYQFYGFLTVAPELRVILGPTRALRGDGRELDGLMALLAVPPEEWAGYAQALRSAPIISVHRMAWLLSSLVTALRGHPFSVEQVWLDTQGEDVRQSVHASHTRRRLEEADDDDTQQLVQQSYAWEQLITSYIEDGKPDILRELFSAPPRVEAGRMAQNGLRQVRNMGICTATLASRAAIRGGLDPQDAFLASDLYIQKMELINDPAAIERLAQEMMIDYAQQVERIKGPETGHDRFFRLCAQYVSQNIFTAIRAERMAEELGYTRAYLCTRFKQEAGISLTRYVQQEKAAEAKRLLRFTDQGLGEIAALLGFSSQSHFQTVFKQITGETPMAYRRSSQV